MNSNPVYVPNNFMYKNTGKYCYAENMLMRLIILKWNKEWSSTLWTQFMQLHIKKPEKIEDLRTQTRDLAIPAGRSNQLSYEATDVASWSIRCSCSRQRDEPEPREGWVYKSCGDAKNLYPENKNPTSYAGYRYTKSLLKLTVVGCGGAEKIKKHGWSFCPCWMPLLEFFHTLKVRFLEFVKFIISEVWEDCWMLEHSIAVWQKNMLFYKLTLFRHLGKRNTIKIVFSSAVQAKCSACWICVQCPGNVVQIISNESQQNFPINLFLVAAEVELFIITMFV